MKKYDHRMRIFLLWHARAAKYASGARIFSKAHRACFQVLVWGLGLRTILRPRRQSGTLPGDRPDYRRGVLHHGARTRGA